ncbi:MAG: lipoprotein [Pedosphaera sp.]|nr:lipoprotein [Pedosphaera sp.]
MTKKNSISNPQAKQINSKKWVWGVLVMAAGIFFVWFFSKGAHFGQANPEGEGAKGNSNPRLVKQPGSLLSKKSDGAKVVEGEQPPGSRFDFTFDSVTVGGKKRSLLSTGRDAKYVPDSDAPSGRDLWIQDETGHERLVDSSVYRAKFSPDGSKIAYTTTEATMRIEDLQGNKVAEVQGAYEPNWKPDGSSVIFSKVPPGLPNNSPGAFQLATVDPATGKVETLTDGKFDDGRPVFDPSGKSILFVSGGRSGLASFWMIKAPGEQPVQITNVGETGVNEKFVPTPYSPKNFWSTGSPWFVYDVQRDGNKQIWGLHLDADGTPTEAIQLAEGLYPRPGAAPNTFAYENTDGKIVESNLPQ